MTIEEDERLVADFIAKHRLYAAEIIEEGGTIDDANKSLRHTIEVAVIFTKVLADRRARWAARQGRRAIIGEILAELAA